MNGLVVTVTGTGTPIQEPGRAGAGVLVQAGGVALQFDAGRGTTLRLAEAGFDLRDLDALFVTHHHSDHLVGLPDLAMSRWLEGDPVEAPALRVVVPEGPAADLVAGMLDVWRPEMELRAAHTGRTGVARMDVRRFTPGRTPQQVFAAGDVGVQAVAVRHEPVVPAVAYRVAAPAGTVVISGDTAVCAEVEALAGGADVLVHEAFRRAALPPGLLSDPEAIAAYHADTVALGAMAGRARVGTLVLTHLIPPPRTAADAAGFEDDVRRGGFTGRVVVAADLTSVPARLPPEPGASPSNGRSPA